jgi:hypothetical protein
LLPFFLSFFLSFFVGNGANLVRIFPAKGVVFASNDFYNQFFASQFSSLNPEVRKTLSGALSGINGSAATYPLDLVRGRISGIVAEKKYQGGIIQCIKVTVAEEGILGLYKGVKPTLIGAPIYEGIKFGTVGFLEAAFPRREQSSNFGIGSGDLNNSYVEDPVLRKMMFGAIGGVMAGVLTYPNDTIRRLLQLQGTGNVAVYDGWLDCFTTIIKTEGIGRLYSGVGINLMRMVPNTALQFGAYEFLSNLGRSTE